MNTNEWRTLVEKSLGESVQAAEEKITSHRTVSEWLQDASYEAAVGTQGVSDRSGMQAYHQLSEEFEKTFASLFEAVRAVTYGCGRVALDWQPGDPRRTTVRLDFGQEFRVHTYQHFQDISEARVDRFLTNVADQLPRGAPYPKKPHRVGAVLSFEDSCVAVRLTEAVSGQGQRRQFVTIYRGGEELHKNIPFDEAAEQVTSYVRKTASV